MARACHHVSHLKPVKIANANSHMNPHAGTRKRQLSVHRGNTTSGNQPIHVGLASNLQRLLRQSQDIVTSHKGERVTAFVIGSAWSSK